MLVAFSNAGQKFCNIFEKILNNNLEGGMGHHPRAEEMGNGAEL